MNRRYVKLILILVLLVAVIWVNLPDNPGIHIGEFNRNLETVLGLDLQGGMQVLLEVDLPEDVEVSPEDLQTARQILENRSNGLGVSEVVFQIAGTRRIVGEFPGLTKTDEVIAVLKETGQLEFVDFGSNYLPEGTVVQTDIGQDQAAEPSVAIPENPLEQTQDETQDQIFHTVMTGDQIKSVSVEPDGIGGYHIAFVLKDEGKVIFAQHTAENVGQFLAIVLDKKVISVPRINSAIPDGAGVVQGDFTIESANNLAVQLRYGSLPIPFKVVESRVIGPTLGEDSLNKSILAGIVGVIIVTLFMTIYYRLPGAVAMLSIATYAMITLALFKLIPVTLTLAGIAGVLLSTGGALDANILIFERLKEELRSGKNLQNALDLSWRRAWPSIRDSNLATLITSAILFWFGSAFGATIVKGFALTLAIGVAISLFCAIVVTRTYLNAVINLIKPENHAKWFGA